MWNAAAILHSSVTKKGVMHPVVLLSRFRIEQISVGWVGDTRGWSHKTSCGS